MESLKSLLDVPESWRAVIYRVALFVCIAAIAIALATGLDENTLVRVVAAVVPTIAAALATLNTNRPGR